MRVLVVITTAFVPHGGLTTVMMNYYRKIDDDCIKFDFASTNDPPESLLEEIRKRGCEYYKLPSRKKHTVGYFLALRRLCRSYDIVHVHGNSATTLVEHLAAKLAGVPKRIAHNHTSMTNHPVLNKLMRPFFKSLYTDAVACSGKAGQWLFGMNKFKIYKNAIDVKRFVFNNEVRKKIRNQIGADDDCIVLGHIGKLYKPKNHSFLIDVFCEFHKMRENSKLFLVGGGELEQEIREKVESLNLKDCVIFMGMRSDIPDMLCVMDAFVFPSLWEGLPLSVLEALASGLPVFLSDTISSEVYVSKQCYPLSLSNGAKKWAEFINGNILKSNRSKLVEENWTLLTEAGYNIETEATKLLNLYKM